jgi:hypothetical protein
MFTSRAFGLRIAAISTAVLPHQFVQAARVEHEARVQREVQAGEPGDHPVGIVDLPGVHGMQLDLGGLGGPLDEVPVHRRGDRQVVEHRQAGARRRRRQPVAEVVEDVGLDAADVGQHVHVLLEVDQHRPAVVRAGEAPADPQPLRDQRRCAELRQLVVDRE